MALILRPTPRNLARAANALRRGEVVALPSETVYGLAADALDERACRRIFAIKGRPATDPLIVHVLDLAQAESVASVTAEARRLARRFWPGGLTLVLFKKSLVPGVVTADRNTVAVRCPAHPVFRQVLKLTNRPLAAPSANPFGSLSPTTAAHVQAGLGRKVGLIIDGGPCEVGLESTILDLSGATPRLLRSGAIAASTLARSLGQPVATPHLALDGREVLPAPGTLKRHYSPRTPLVLHSRLPDPSSVAAGGTEEAFVYLRRPRNAPQLCPTAHIHWLSDRGELRAAGQRLFALLHQLDRLGLQRIHIELAPNRGAGIAINDRLRRAAAPPLP
jgi:L-threonylcarbamoyladenylate synthase